MAGERSGHRQSSVLGLLSFHRNGFVRHKALRLLSQCLDGSEFPFLVIRQNDWVPSIAQEAQEAVSERINDAYLTHIVRSLRLIMHLMSYRRHDFQGVVRKVEDLLLCERHSEILRAAIGSSDPMVRRQVVRIGLEATGTYQARLVAFGVDSDDPIIRLQCCQHAATAFEPNQLRDVLRRLTADQFMPVRRAALVVQADQFPHLACNTWQQALFDCSRSIRELARFSLERLGYTEFANNYRDVIAKQPSNLAALQGLAETGETSDTELFLDLLRHSFPSRRIAGINGLVRTSNESVVPEIAPLLGDISARVIREATKAVAPDLHLIAGEELVSVALQAPGPFARRNAVVLLAELGKWRSIPWLLRVALEAEYETAAFAKEMLNSWFVPPKCNRVFVRPTQQERQNIAAALPMAIDNVSEETLARIKASLGQFE